MAKAPLSRIVILTEDGSTVRPTEMVTIPPRNVIPPNPGPVITTPAGINSDGTPQAGETLTGIDPTGNGPIVARRWVLDGVTVSTDRAHTTMAGGAYRFEADLQGPNGGIATSFSTITVAGATINTVPDDTQIPPAQIAGFPEWVAEQDAILIGKAR